MKTSFKIVFIIISLIIMLLINDGLLAMINSPSTFNFILGTSLLLICDLGYVFVIYKLFFKK
jgi:hypothetical protein